jgi:four helix bundle protein
LNKLKRARRRKNDGSRIISNDIPVFPEFEDLPVWKLAKDLAVEVYQIMKDDNFRRDYGTVDHISQASVSVLTRVAEGFERGSKGELVQFLFIAKGSPGKVASGLQVSFELG